MAERLIDDKSILDSATKAKLERKLVECMTKMLGPKDSGGNPFLFTLVVAKQHYVTESVGDGFPIHTAATDGKNYYWNPKFLESLSSEQLRVVIEHEAYHNVFYHTSIERTSTREAKIWNIAVDYVVNTVILCDRTGNITANSPQEDANKVFTGPPVGTAIALKEFMAVLTGKAKQPEGTICFADKTLLSKSADWIYDELMSIKDKVLDKYKGKSGKCCPQHCPNHGNQGQQGQEQQNKGNNPSPGSGQQSPGQGKGKGKKNQGQGGGNQPGSGSGGQDDCTCGGGLFDSMDDHLQNKLSKEESTWETLRAANAAKALGRGDLPSGVKEFIEELGNPTLRASDIIKMAMLRKRADSGTQKDYKRYRRRGLAARPVIYQPRYWEMKPRWIAMLDTSGSHDAAAMRRGITELKLIGDSGEGLIIPCDAQPYWDHATKVSGLDNLKRVDATGRGGTVFEQFFKELPTKAPGHWDLVCVISDGEVGQIPRELKPHTDVLWIITNDHVDYKPSFGRLIHLQGNR